MSDFIPTHYAIRTNGQPMPARIIREEAHLVTVQAPNGREYSFPLDAVLPAAEAEAIIRRDRVALVSNSYAIRLSARGTLRSSGAAFQVFSVSHPTDARRSYSVAIGAVTGCTCPAFEEAGDCKHLEAVKVQNPTPEPDVKPEPVAPAQRKSGPYCMHNMPPYFAERGQWLRPEVCEECRKISEATPRPRAQEIAAEDW